MLKVYLRNIMSHERYKYIYGPVLSWRLGRSLGIDPISAKDKVCTFDCVYCQIGDAKICSGERKVFVATKDIMEEIKSLPPIKIDYMTFSGTGEPTLAKNLGELINEIKNIRNEKIAVITNSSLLNLKDVQADLMNADFVMAKLDAPDKELFNKINRPVKGITFDNVISGIKEFRTVYNGKLALQIMFIDQNKGRAKELAELVKKLSPDEVQLNTPLRPCATEPLSKKELDAIKEYFKDMNVKYVYESEKKKVDSLSEKDTSRRRGKV